MEKVTLFVVTDSLKVYQVVAIRNKRSQKVVCFYYTDDYDDSDAEWINNSDSDNYVFFNTKEEADEHALTTYNELKSKCKEIKELIERIDNIDNPANKYSIKREEYIPSWILNKENYYDEYYKERKKNRNLRKALISGYININAETFKISDVRSIRWCEKNGENFATIILNNGDEIKTHNDYEFYIIEDIFGENNSGMVYKK